MAPNCFVCTGEIRTRTRNSQNSEENSLILCQILDIPHLGNDVEKLDEISYCPGCLDRILNIRNMLEELEKMEKKVLDAKYVIETQFKDTSLSYRCDRSSISALLSSEQLRVQIVSELRSTSVQSMLGKIRKKQVGRKLSRPKSVRVMQDVIIPRSESHQNQIGNITPRGMNNDSEDTPSNVLPDMESCSSPSSVANHPHFERQITSTPSKETAEEIISSDLPEIEVCDIKYEIMEQVEDMTGDPLGDITVTEMDVAKNNEWVSLSNTTPYAANTRAELNVTDPDFDVQIPGTSNATDSESENEESEEPARKRRSGNREWDFVQNFPSKSEALKYIKSEEIWRLNKRTQTSEGAKEFYICKFNRRCWPSLLLLFPCNDSTVVQLYRCQGQHTHQPKPSHGIQKVDKEVIQELFSSGIRKPKGVLRIMKQKGHDEIPMTQLRNYLAYLRKKYETSSLSYVSDFQPESGGN